MEIRFVEEEPELTKDELQVAFRLLWDAVQTVIDATDDLWVQGYLYGVTDGLNIDLDNSE